jgi:hypothetical protein
VLQQLRHHARLALALVLSFPIRLVLAKKDLWQMFAAWLIR